MYLDSLLLTRAAAAVDADNRRVTLGDVWDGYFLFEEFPVMLDFGVYVEVGFDPNENGEHELRVVGEVVSASRSEERTLFHRDDIWIAESDDGWWVSRLRAFPFEAHWEFDDGEDDIDFQLVVFGDGEFLGDKPVLMRRCPVPDAPPAF